MKGCCLVFKVAFYDKLSLFITMLLYLVSYIREKIIKYDESSYGNLKNIKIEFSRDKTLVDLLFEMKKTLNIKKKTFI